MAIRKKHETDQQYDVERSYRTSLIDSFHQFYNVGQAVGLAYSTVSSIPANTRTVHQVRFSGLSWIDRAFVCFNFQDESTNNTTQTKFQYFLGSMNDTGSYTAYTPIDTFTYNSVLVYKDMRYSSRFVGANSKYEYTSGSSARTYGYTNYSNSENNILIGYYNTAGVINGAFYTGTSLKVVVENLWFSEDGNDLILNMAFRNQEASSASVAKGFTSYIFLV